MNTVKINVNYLAGPALNWAVNECEGTQPSRYTEYATQWRDGGPIIEREGIRLHRSATGAWWAGPEADPFRPVSGPTPLIAAMRCFVASKLGEIVEVPRELYKEEA